MDVNLGDCMKGFVWHKDGTASMEEIDMPRIIEDTDAVVKVKMSSICTSDLHIIHGFVPKAKSETVLGHEFVGEIVELGKSVTNFKVSDRVAVNVETFCGECFFCRKGFVNNCVNGGWKLGCSENGCQSEYVRVPFANNGMTRLPENVSYEDALFVGDVLSSGYWGAELCEIKKGDVIAVIGSGPVGYCAMMSAKVLGASKVIAIDIDNYRLGIAQNQGIADVVLNPSECDLLTEIHKYTEGRGVDAVIEAAGGEETFQTAWQIARPNAIVAVVAMYESPQILPLPDMYGKNLIFKTGGVDANHCDELVRLISENKISTNFMITHKFPFEKISDAYEVFGNRKDGCIKVALTY